MVPHLRPEISEFLQSVVAATIARVYCMQILILSAIFFAVILWLIVIIPKCSKQRFRVFLCQNGFNFAIF